MPMHAWMCTHTLTHRQITAAMALALKIEDIYDIGQSNGNWSVICDTSGVRKYLNKTDFKLELLSSSPQWLVTNILANSNSSIH